MNKYHVKINDKGNTDIFVNMCEKHTYWKDRFIGQGKYEFFGYYGTMLDVSIKKGIIKLVLFAASSYEPERNSRLLWTLNESNQWILDDYHNKTSEFHTTVRQLKPWYISGLFYLLQEAFAEHPEILEFEPRFAFVPKEMKDLPEFGIYDDPEYLSEVSRIEDERYEALTFALKLVQLGETVPVVMPITGNEYTISSLNLGETEKTFVHTAKQV